ncbi:MAG: putative bifunctional diguanylate cyclase/phosphodiesterase [Clostridium sp.]
MKLIKRFKLFNLIAFIASIIISLGFLKGFSDGAKNGENLRLAEISNGVIHSLSKLLNHQRDLMLLFYNDIYTINNNKPIPENTYISYCSLVNSNNINDESKIIYSKDNDANFDSKIKLLSTTLLSNTNITSKFTIINYSNTPYIIDISRIDDSTYDTLIFAIPISNDVLNYIGTSTDSTVTISLGLDTSNKIYRSTFFDKEYLFLDEGNYLSTLFEFNELGFDNTYLKITQEKHVFKMVIKNFLIFTILLLFLFLAINLSIYLIIKHTILKRILSLSHSVKNISENNLILDLSLKDKYSDEISELCNEISTMSVRIASVSEEIRNLATYDSLTSLYNRRWLNDYCEYLIANSKSFSLYFIDLDNFKKVNDNIGHDYGDKLLIRVSKRLKEISSDTVKIGRFGGDEFVILHKNTITEDEINNFSDELLNLISRTYRLKNFNFELKCSIGVATYPLHGRNASALFKHADISMYQSKKILGNSCCIFSSEMIEDYALENNLVNALSNDDIITIFQPIFNVNTGKMDTVEALARWKTESGLISPGDFIPLAKKTGLIVNLDKKMIVNSCKLYRRYVNKYHIPLTISFNVSYTLLTSPDFLDFVIKTSKKYEVPYKNIKIEITEDETISDLDYVISILRKLTTKGFLVALDDFGVGYSSFNYVKKLPLTTIKIDRSLISNIETDEKSLVLVKDLIPLLKTLDLEVICEGIETLNQYNILTQFNCDKLQGFYFSKPVEQEDLFNIFDSFNS